MALAAGVVAAINAAPAPAHAQVIPEARRVDWGVAGYPGELPRPATIVDARDFGAIGDGTTDDRPAIATAIASLGGEPGVVRLPAGTYRIVSGISIPSGVVVRGEGSDSTVVRCDLPASGSSCFSFTGTHSGDWRPVTGGLGKGSTALTLVDASGFSPGDFAELRQANGAWDTKPADWAKNVVGQVVRITSVDGPVITIEHPLRADYDLALSPEVARVVPVVDAGIEDLAIERVSDPDGSGGGNNVQFSLAARCWLEGVEGRRSIGSHVGVYRSTQVQIRGCHFHDAFTYDGSATRGYGVTLNDHSGECLIEGNVFEHLRHAMMVKTGANGNVFAYNYARDPIRSEVFSDFSADISVHGHWPFANLFEGNVVGMVMIDQYWGPAGPHNTFFRNREETYGLVVAFDSPSNDQNFVGNEVMGGKSSIVLDVTYGLPYAIKGKGHLEHGNNVKGSIRPPGTDELPDVSYYRDAGADFCELAAGWPAIGVPAAIGTGIIRAQERWTSGGKVTYDFLRVSAPPPVEVVPGESVVLRGDARGGRQPLVVEWTPWTGLDDPHAIEPTATPAATTTYTLTATDANGCSRSASVKVTVTGTAEVEQGPEPVAEPVPEPVDEPLSEPVAEPLPEPVNEPLPEPIGEPAPDLLGEPGPEPEGEPVPEDAPELTSDAVADPAPEQWSEPVEGAEDEAADPVAGPGSEPAVDTLDGAAQDAVDEAAHPSTDTAALPFAPATPSSGGCMAASDGARPLPVLLVLLLAGCGSSRTRRHARMASIATGTGQASVRPPAPAA